ncbi:DNA-3-methyladenine glycosylase family protein [Paenibacillus piri]|uniref:DNA-3-methyladenine glycosylase II n=1 Tax=Paenibacillus piri TaxID=2547395 RepID=A0A4R5KFB3_9BACL|nr:DNA-3-methyladenine glycosylase [Paenibacillus piri]TDF93298.1 DNA-3-methyladenine glycosylase 2 family protein [Paenibacillus piri]
MTNETSAAPTIPKQKWIDHGDALELLPPADFSFDATLGYLTRSANECMFHTDAESGSLYRLIPCSDRPGDHALVKISGADGSILISPAEEGTALPEAPLARAAVAAYVWDWFDLSVDMQPFYDLARHDPLLSEAVKRFYGLRIVGITDLFEALCWGVIGQQINLAFAYTLKRRFVEAFGQSVQWNGRAYWTFPTPEAVAEATVDDLTPLQLTGKKSEYLIGIAGLMAEGSLSKSKLLQNMDDIRALEKELTRIRGIGPWTANYVIMRCLKHPAAFPIEDVGLHNAIKHLLRMERKPTIEEIERLSVDWGNWKAYATFYLWRVLY